jgi:hypothetical protein
MDAAGLSIDKSLKIMWVAHASSMGAELAA